MVAIIKMLRFGEVLTADVLAATLDVSTRTIYRDLDVLQSLEIGIVGEPGVGYMMRKGK